MSTTTPYDGLFSASSARYNVPETILKAVAWVESTMQPGIDPNPPRDGVGLMQVTEATARTLGYTGIREGLKDPAVNIDLGAKYLAGIIRSQGGINLADLYSEYNSGRAGLWRISSEVAAHVARFLRFFAVEVGISLPSNVNIEDALLRLRNISEETYVPLLFVLALVLFLKR